MAPAPKHSPQEQEDIILTAAAKCIEESSLLDFTMSSISKEANLSMGSIYKHMQCKEDIIFALATKVFQYHRSVFKQVLALPATTPEKAVGIALLNPTKIQVFPFDSHLESFAANELVISRVSSLWTKRMIDSCEACEKIFFEHMDSAMRSGELMFDGDPEQLIEEINLGCWAIMEGFKYISRIVQIRNISEGSDSLGEPLATDSIPVRNLQRLLNSLQWKQPLEQSGIEKIATLMEEAGLR